MLLRKQYALVYEIPGEPDIVLVAVPERVARRWHREVKMSVGATDYLTSIVAEAYNRAKKRRYRDLKRGIRD